MAERELAGDYSAADSLTVEGQRFAIVPEWVIDADIGDCAFRLYAVLLRYGQSSGRRMPSRATLARRLRKKSVDTVDRAMKELVQLGAVVVERRHDGKQNLTNRYHVRTTAPGRSAAATPPRTKGGRTDAAGSYTIPAATRDRTGAATPAVFGRPDPESLTQEESRPTGVDLAEQCRTMRRRLGLPIHRWSAAAVEAALERCRERGWPDSQAARALEVVAADPSTRSPYRVAEAGPWWNASAAPADDGGPAAHDASELGRLEAELDECVGQRVPLQRLAREQLAAEGAVLTRETVVRRAVLLLREQRDRREVARGNAGAH